MPTITNKGQEYALLGDGSADGSIARKAVAVRLYVTDTPAPAKDGTGFTQPSGGGYAEKVISVADWTLALDAGDQKITLGDQVWTAAGGSISNIAGAYIVDAAGNALAWWERASQISIISGDQLTISGIVLKAS